MSARMVPAVATSATSRGELLRKARRRQREGGAIIFVTAMTLAVLTSLTLYALAATRTEVRSSGYETRQAMSEGVAQWALNAEMWRLDPTGGAANDITKVTNQSSFNTSLAFNGCVANATQPSSPLPPSQTTGCYRIGLVGGLIGGSLTNSPQAGPNLWSPTGTHAYNATYDMWVELTNAVDPPTGMEPGELTGTTKMTTISVYGIMKMGNSSGLTTGTEIVHVSRGHLIAKVN